MSIRKVGVTPLLTAATTTATGDSKEIWHTNRTFEAYGTTSAGSGAASVVIEVRNAEDADWKTLATISLTLGTAVLGDGLATTAAWRYCRARIASISGTGASVSANVGAAIL